MEEASGIAAPFVKLPLAWDHVLLERIYDWGYDGEPLDTMAARRIECARVAMRPNRTKPTARCSMRSRLWASRTSPCPQPPPACVPRSSARGARLWPVHFARPIGSLASFRPFAGCAAYVGDCLLNGRIADVTIWYRLTDTVPRLGIPVEHMNICLLFERKIGVKRIWTLSDR